MGLYVTRAFSVAAAFLFGAGTWAAGGSLMASILGYSTPRFAVIGGVLFFLSLLYGRSRLGSSRDLPPSFVGILRRGHLQLGKLAQRNCTDDEMTAYLMLWDGAVADFRTGLAWLPFTFRRGEAEFHRLRENRGFAGPLDLFGVVLGLTASFLEIPLSWLAGPSPSPVLASRLTGLAVPVAGGGRTLSLLGPLSWRRVVRLRRAARWLGWNGEDDLVDWAPTHPEVSAVWDGVRAGTLCRWLGLAAGAALAISPYRVLGAPMLLFGLGWGVDWLRLHPFWGPISRSPIEAMERFRVTRGAVRVELEGALEVGCLKNREGEIVLRDGKPSLSREGVTVRGWFEPTAVVLEPSSWRSSDGRRRLVWSLWLQLSGAIVTACWGGLWVLLQLLEV